MPRVLGLLSATPEQWADFAASRVVELLEDHAHCELKAASNALSLAARAPGDIELTRALVDLAEEELSHFRAVLAELAARGRSLGPPPPDEYVSELRRRASAARRASAPRETFRRGSPAGGLEGAALVDRLLVGALIEARSCERFSLLESPLRAAGEARLADFYAQLFEAEARHYRVLFDLAVRAAQGDEGEVKRRLSELLEVERDVASGFGRKATMHG